MAVIERIVTGEAGGEYKLVFYSDVRFTLDPVVGASKFRYLADGPMKVCGLQIPIGWIEWRIDRAIHRAERRRVKRLQRESEIKARWVTEPKPKTKTVPPNPASPRPPQPDRFVEDRQMRTRPPRPTYGEQWGNRST